MTETVPGAEGPVRPLSLFGVAIAGVLAGACLGAATNAVSGRVSPHYFVAVLRWGDVGDVWRAAIAQGIFEGLLFGSLFSLVFAAGTGIITRASCPFGLAARHLAIVVAGALVSWVFGGVAGVGLAALSPEFYRRTFRGAPEEWGPLLGYAWVGGSIWGLQLGGLISVVLGLVILRGHWQRRRGAGAGS